MTDDAAAALVLIEVVAMPNVMDSALIAIALRRRLLFMLCSLDLLAV
jgi:hypothetical protein